VSPRRAREASPHRRPARARWFALLLAALCSPAVGATAAVTDPQPDTLDVAAALAAGDLAFLSTPEGPADFRAQRGPLTAWFDAQGFLLALCGTDGRGVALRFALEGARAVAPQGEDPRRDRHHVIDGQGRLARRAGFDRLRWPQPLPGVDLVLRGAAGSLQYDLLLAPQTPAESVRLRVQGASGLGLEEDGTLLIATPLGVLRQPAPLVWETSADGTPRRLPARFVLLDADCFGFEVEGRDAGAALVIDPALQWATFLGGTSFDYVQALAADSSGDLFVAGYTNVAAFPTTPGAFDTTHNGQRDAFVTRLSGDGSTLVASTLLGGHKDDEARALVLDGSGGVVLGGFTASSDFPTSVNGFDRSFGGGSGTLKSDGFVARLSGDLGTLIFSTFVGGSGDDLVTALAVDETGDVWATGKTASVDFPTSPGALDTSWNGGSADGGDVFVVRLASTGASLQAATLLGGSGDDLANALVLDGDGHPIVAGWTGSPDFPLPPGAWDSTLGGGADAFVVRLVPQLQSLAGGTLLGGSSDDNAFALALAPDGRVLVTGTTRSASFPALGPQLPHLQGAGAFYGDGFLVRLAADLAAPDWSTRFGGANDDVPVALRVDEVGTVLVAGWTQSPGFPVTASETNLGLLGSTDGFLLRADGDAEFPLLSRFLGGSSADRGLALTLTQQGAVILAGWTASASFPVTSGAHDTSFGGFEGLIGDGFVASLDFGLPPAGANGSWVDLGYAHPGSGGLLPHLSGTGLLVPHAAGSVTLDFAAPHAPALLIVSDQAGFVPIPGGTLVPFPILNVFAHVTDEIGRVHIPYTWPASADPGQQLFVQASIEDPGASSGRSASNALQITAW